MPPIRRSLRARHSDTQRALPDALPSAASVYDNTNNSSHESTPFDTTNDPDIRHGYTASQQLQNSPNNRYEQRYKSPEYQAGSQLPIDPVLLSEPALSNALASHSKDASETATTDHLPGTGGRRPEPNTQESVLLFDEIMNEMLPASLQSVSKRSWVWEYGESVIVGGKRSWKCKLCKLIHSTYCILILIRAYRL